MVNYLRAVLCLLSLSYLWPVAGYAELPDPTRPPGITQMVVNEHTEIPVLNAIIGTPDQKLAVINGHILHVGDQFANMKVVAIGINTVELEGTAGKITLALLSYPLKPLN